MGTTFYWIGGQGGSGDPNDSSDVANWATLIEGVPFTSGSLPGAGDSIFVAVPAPLGGTGTLDDSGSNFVANSVTLDGAGPELQLADMTIDTASSIAPDATATTATIDFTAPVTNAGTILQSGSGDVLALALAGTLLNTGLIQATAGQILVQDGGGGALDNEGTIAVAGGQLTIAPGVSGLGVLSIGAGTLVLDGSVAFATPLEFLDDAGELTIGAGGSFSGPVIAFAPGETIDLTSIDDASLEPLAISDDVLTLTDGSNTIALAFAGDGYGTSDFSTTSDAGGGTLLMLAASAEAVFNAGTSGSFDWSSAIPGAGATSAKAVLVTGPSDESFALDVDQSVTALSLTMLAPLGTLAIDNPADSVALSDGLIDEDGTVAVGGALTSLSVAGALVLGPDGVVTVAGGTLSALLITTPGTFANGTEQPAGTMSMVGGSASAPDGVALENVGLAGAASLNAGTQLVAVNLGVSGGAQATAASLTVFGPATLDGGSIDDTGGASADTLALGNGASLGVGGDLFAGAVSLLDSTLSAGAADDTLSVGGLLTLDAVSGLVVGGTSASAGVLAVQSGAIALIGTLSTLGAVSVDALSSLVAGIGAPVTGTVVVAADAIAAMANLTTPTLDLEGTADIAGTLTASAIISFGNGTLVGSDLTINTAQTFDITVMLPPASPSTAASLALSHAGDFGGTVVVQVAPATGDGPVSTSASIDLQDVPLASAQAVFNPTQGIASLGTLAPFAVVADQAAGASWSIGNDGNNDTELSVTFTVCYAAGTRIATPAGEAPVEALRPGDSVLALEGGAWVARPVRWVGMTTVDLDRHPQPRRAAPIRVRADSVAPGVPRRDLLVSPDHALCLDGALFQAQALANGATIVREPPRGAVTYVHVELDRHSLLLAEGLPAESFLDTGNRGWFAAEAGVRPLFPDFCARRTWTQDACAPLLLDGLELAAAHAKLWVRAIELGHQRSDDPALSVLADAGPVPLAATGPLAWRARLPAGTTLVRLQSRGFVPRENDPACLDDRRLGLPVAALLLGGRALPAPAFAAGWHAAEAGWRWSDGDGHLRLQPRRGGTVLEIRVVPAAPGYWVAPDRAVPARRRRTTLPTAASGEAGVASGWPSGECRGKSG